MNYLTTGKVILGLTLMFLTTGIQAQSGTRMHAQQRSSGDSGMYRHTLPNLTTDQKQKIEALRVAHMKDMNAYRNDLAIKKAELQKYKTSDKPDMVLINNTIDDMGKIITDMQKKLVAHQIAVRSLLTDEQKVVYDARMENRGMRPHISEPGMMQHHEGPSMKHSEHAEDSSNM